MNQSNEINNKIKTEFIQLLDYYIRKIDYSKQISADASDQLGDLFEILQDSERALLDIPSATVKKQIRKIQQGLDCEEVINTPATQQDFLEELELFKIRYNLEE